MPFWGKFLSAYIAMLRNIESSQTGRKWCLVLCLMSHLIKPHTHQVYIKNKSCCFAALTEIFPIRESHVSNFKFTNNPQAQFVYQCNQSTFYWLKICILLIIVELRIADFSLFFGINTQCSVHNGCTTTNLDSLMIPYIIWKSLWNWAQD